ncbi:transcriptional repressor LexA [Endozoicomonas sp. SCSIO W0465]|uniref:transcriptional repressor LexA n=1 Tax=Endozoicomonas sp. SCSIO W0465 TaxID=2918516 RepID=UPI002074D50A|nr:transcriptional repressor LexA [Endozoicomonas sp. SCSIO W0465]USE39310.1 transcriptional repressor LexA [Endozoicomonas sp. SCSIO W0465]
MYKLTKRQTEILELIKSHIEETGFPPTRAEIAQTFGFRSPNAAEEHLRALARKGAIEITPGTSRGIRIPGTEYSGLPIVGQVSAGSPILAQEHIEDHLSINPDFFSPKADFMLRVKGMSMKNIGILDGDLLAVHKTSTVSNGQIVVARIEDEVTVKRFEQVKNTVYLHPENEEFQTIEVDLSVDNFAIEGLSVGVIRN